MSAAPRTHSNPGSQLLVILYEAQEQFRQIFLDGRTLPKIQIRPDKNAKRIKRANFFEVYLTAIPVVLAGFVANRPVSSVNRSVYL